MKTKSEMNEPIQTLSHSFIATFDILGVTQMMLAADDGQLESFATGMCKAFAAVQNRMYELIESSSDTPLASKESAIAIINEMDFTTFSDTIVLGCDIDRVTNDYDRQRLVMNFFLRSIFIVNEMLAWGYPVRGCIDFGKVCLAETSGLFFGRPYVNSLKMAEQLDFAGIVLTADALKIYNQIIPEPIQVVRVLNLPIPIRTGEYIDAGCLNWLVRKDFKRYASQDIRQMLYAKFSANGKRMGESALRKMTNTEYMIRAFMIQGEKFPVEK